MFCLMIPYIHYNYCQVALLLYSQDLMQASITLEMKASSQLRCFPSHSNAVTLRGTDLAASTSMTNPMISAWAIELVSCVGSAHRTRGWTSLSLAVGNAMRMIQLYSHSLVSTNVLTYSHLFPASLTSPSTFS